MNLLEFLMLGAKISSRFFYQLFNFRLLELDKAIKDDPTHPHTNAKDALMAAVEGKLPIVKADGTLKPIEMTFTLKYDPTTGSIDIDKS